MPIKACVFDAYGTLFDVASAARTAAAEPANAAIAESWQKLAEDWRLKQLEYSWLRAITGEHADFWQLTQDGLDWALAAQGLTDTGLRARLLALYRTLAAYPEVPAMLTRLGEAGIASAILSNGAPDMLSDAVASAGIGGLLDAVLSVEEVGIFKPAPQAYELATEWFDCAAEEILFISSNGWDAAGAAKFGFFTVWVNRTGAPAERLGHPPHEILPDLTLVPDIAGAI